MSTYFGVQTDRLHGGGVVRIGAVAEGLSTAAKTAERTVVVGVVHRWSLVVHYGKGVVVRSVSGGEGVREEKKEGMETTYRW